MPKRIGLKQIRKKASPHERERLVKKARAFGMKRIAEALDVSYSHISQKFNGFGTLYADEIDVIEAVMNKSAA